MTSNRHSNSGTGIRRINVGGGRFLEATAVFDTYWRFAAKRQEIFFKRVEGAAQPWTDDSVLLAHRFTNTYRASDRVSQFLIKEVLYRGSQKPEEIVFRCLLFKLFNKIDTWRMLEREVGEISWRRLDLETYGAVLDRAFGRGESIYSGAYIIPSPRLGSVRKHRNHLALLDQMMRGGLPTRLEKSASLKEVFEVLSGYPSLGPFLAFQFAIDLNYSSVVDFSEMDYVVAGPGARDGIRKCFANLGGLSEEEVIAVVAQLAPDEFARLGISFPTLWGRALQLIDCQNIFCEVDKYSRVVHPTVFSRRTRIKQRFRASLTPLPQWYPPKWNISVPPFDSARTPAVVSRSRRNLELFAAT